MFVPACQFVYAAEELQKYQKLDLSLMQVAGFNIEELLDLFAKGYTLTPPTYTQSLSELVDKEIK